MDTTLPELRSGCLLVLAAPHAARDLMMAFIARLALRGHLQALDAGNRFNAYKVARALRALQGHDMAPALARIHIARAFTCHQVLTLLEQTPASPMPTLVLDLLDTFYDESVLFAERRRLLNACVARLRWLSRHTVTVVSLRPPPPSCADPTGFVEVLLRAADEVWAPPQVTPLPPPRLFD